MPEDKQRDTVKRLLSEYVRSPSLRHIRAPYSLDRLARNIVRKLSNQRSTWRKWDEPREALLKAAVPCWIPIDDLRDYLNGMPGPVLTTTDVAQRLRAFCEDDPYLAYPDEDLQASCLAIYQRERADGTELPAIIGLLQEHVECEEQRMRSERETAWRNRAEEERRALEERFLSGADCKWTPVQRSKELYCRINGRTYRLSPTAEKMWNLHRIKSVEDGEGTLLGTYRYRRDVTKVLSEIAYRPEPRW